jgi:hypothetical protein
MDENMADRERVESKHYKYYVRKSFDGSLNIYTCDGGIVSVGCEPFTGELTQEIAELLIKAWMDGLCHGQSLNSSTARSEQ